MRRKFRAAITPSFVLLAVLSGCREPNQNSASVELTQTTPAIADKNPETDAQAAPGAAIEPAALCNIEMVDGVLFGSDTPRVGSSARIRGWLGSDAGKPLDHPLLVMADANKTVVSTFPLQLNIDRPDVVQAYPGRVGLEKSGFEVSVSPDASSGADYHLYLTYGSDQRHFICDNGRRIRFAD